MTSVEWACLGAAVAAGVGAFLHLMPAAERPRPWQVAAVARGLVAVAVGLVAVAIALLPGT